MLKRYYSLITFILSFICLYLANLYDVFVLNAIFILIFIFAQRYIGEQKYEMDFIKQYEKFYLPIALFCLVVFLLLKLVFKADKIYTDLFFSLVLSLSILKGSMVEK